MHVICRQGCWEAGFPGLVPCMSVSLHTYSVLVVLLEQHPLDAAHLDNNIGVCGARSSLRR